MKLTLLSSVFNDWESADELLVVIDDELSRANLQADVLFVNDGSSQSPPDSLVDGVYKAIGSVKVLNLRSNLGHQRGIAIGLSYIYENKPCDAIVIMDADGEDEPADIVRLVEALRRETEACVVFAKRVKRSEGMVFAFFYHLYLWLFAQLTGTNIQYGNFSIVPFSLLGRIVVDANLWNHYAAALTSSRLVLKTIPSRRGKRLYGTSKLNFTNLVIHGLSAMSCYNEVIAARLIFSSLVAIVFLVAGILLVGIIRLVTDLAIAGWATSTIGLLTIIALQVLLMSMTFLFILLGNRKNQPFIPLRDYKDFILP